MDDIDRQLLIELQNGIPVGHHPFEGVGKKLNTDSADVLLRIHSLKTQGAIRHVGAIFNGEKVGYRSTLIAMDFAGDQLESAAKTVGEHPGILFAVKAGHAFNLWCILTLPAGESLEAHLVRLAEQAGARKTMVLETEKIFKPATRQSGQSETLELTEFELELLRCLQEDLPLTDAPYAKIARDLGVEEERVLESVQAFLKNGLIRKVAAVSFQKSRESKAQILVVWQVPQEKLEFVTAQLCAQKEVTACVKRAAYPDFPYGLHTLTNFQTQEQCELWIRDLSQEMGRWPYQVIQREQDFKKTRIQYFSQDIQNWRLSHQTQPDVF